MGGGGSEERSMKIQQRAEVFEVGNKNQAFRSKI